MAARFEELRELCELVGEKVSLAIGMTGLATELLFAGHVGEAARVASEQMALLDSIGDPGLTVGAGFMAVLVKYRIGEAADILRWSQTVIDWADGDPAKGNLIVGSPLAVALAWRGVARSWLGRDGWRQDLVDANAMARRTDPATHALVITWTYGFGIASGALPADDGAVRELDEALRIAEKSRDDYVLSLIKYTLGFALIQRDDAKDHQRGLRLLEHIHDMCLHHRFYQTELPGLEMLAAREMAGHGDLDSAIPMVRNALNDLFQEGQLTGAILVIAGLVQILLERGTEDDVAEAEEAIDRLATLPVGDRCAVRDIVLMWMRALLARARGDDVTYRDYRDRYGAMARSLGFEGHIAIAEAM